MTQTFNFNINNIDDVRAFAKHLTFIEGVAFHCDDDFNDYINSETKEATYTQEEAELRNVTMQKCFEVCEKEGVEIYDLMSQHQWWYNE